MVEDFVVYLVRDRNGPWTDRRPHTSGPLSAIDFPRFVIPNLVVGLTIPDNSSSGTDGIGRPASHCYSAAVIHHDGRSYNLLSTQDRFGAWTSHFSPVQAPLTFPSSTLGFPFQRTPFLKDSTSAPRATFIITDRISRGKESNDNSP